MVQTQPVFNSQITFNLVNLLCGQCTAISNNLGHISYQRPGKRGIVTRYVIPLDRTTWISGIGSRSHCRFSIHRDRNISRITGVAYHNLPRNRISHANIGTSLVNVIQPDIIGTQYVSYTRLARIATQVL